MDITIAIQICKGYGEGLGLSGFAETLARMKAQKEQKSLSQISETALNTVLSQGYGVFNKA